MTPRELRIFMVDNELSGAGLARLTAVSDARVVRRWLAGDRDIPGPVVQLMTLLNSMTARARKDAIKLIMRAPADA